MLKKKFDVSLLLSIIENINIYLKMLLNSGFLEKWWIIFSYPTVIFGRRVYSALRKFAFIIF